MGNEKETGHHLRGGASLHGETAARRQAITELLFFASVGDLYRCKKICHTWRIEVAALVDCLEHTTFRFSGLIRFLI